MELLTKINNGWQEFIHENMDEINNILGQINFDTEIIFPQKENIFRSLFYFSPEDIKLVILGQDPYPSSELINNNEEPHACGLAFSVSKNHKKIPPSLKNIFKELKNCYPDFTIPKNGCLKRWSKEERILLLNSSLTVIKGKSNSHADLWMPLTDKLIQFISEKNEKVIFLLMGNFAIKKEKIIDNKIFKCVHPSPLSASRGFFHSNIFKKINDYLEEENQDPINWIL
jgi:uracil-DNA glycosylase